MQDGSAKISVHTRSLRPKNTPPAPGWPRVATIAGHWTPGFTEGLGHALRKHVQGATAAQPVTLMRGVKSAWISAAVRARS